MSSDCTVSVLDFSRLTQLLAAPVGLVPRSVLDELDDKLAGATLVQPAAIEPDVVTMNSKVLLASPVWADAREYRLVYPHRGASPSGELSILSELGTALFAAKIGARLSLGWGVTHREIELVGLSYQPEAAGDWEL